MLILLPASWNTKVKSTVSNTVFVNLFLCVALYSRQENEAIK